VQFPIPDLLLVRAQILQDDMSTVRPEQREELHICDRYKLSGS
jgi:hypothetical protein